MHWAKEVATSETPSLFRALRKTFFWQALGGLFWKIFNDASQFVGPMILKHLILIAHPDKDGHYEPSYVGYLLAFGMFAGQVVGAFGECQYFQTMMRVGMQTRSGKCTNEALHTSSAFRRPPDLVGVPCTPLARGSEATPSTLSQEVFFFFPCSFDYINMSRCSVTVFF